MSETEREELEGAVCELEAELERVKRQNAAMREAIEFALGLSDSADQIKAHLELLKQVTSHLPANERLDVIELDKILRLHQEWLGVFCFQLELQGFKLKVKDEPPKT